MSPLPVTLISFTGKRVENKNLLEWKVTDESKFQGYEVERSTTGKNFEKIATVAAIVNKKTAPTDYQFVDDIPTTASFFTGIFYYRLKMIDLDGSFALSRMVSVNNDFGKTQVSSVYPNPSIKRKVTVDVTIQKAGNWQPQVFSSTGILYSSTNVALQKGYNQVTLDLKGHPLN